MNEMPTLEDPPERVRGRGRKADPRHGQAASVAMSNPGDWVKVGHFRSSLAASIKRGSHLSYPGKWDATVRSNEKDCSACQEGLKALFVCYLGDN